MRPDFIERRRRPRILTWRNTAKLASALLVAFIGITIHSELGGAKPHEYGRLMERQVRQEIPQKPRVEVVQEAAPRVDDQTSPDPMLVAPLAREQQWLHEWKTGNPACPDGQDCPSSTAQAQTIAPHGARSDLVIVGGPEGVRIERQERRKPQLSGGFGR